MATRFNIQPEAFALHSDRRTDHRRGSAAGKFYIEPEAFEFDPEFNEYERGWGELEGEFGEYEAIQPARATATPAKFGDLAIRIDVIGHASPRWKAARTPSEADRLNQRLSDLRATNVRKAVEQILHTELPRFPIKVPSKGVGSKERFPSATEDNAAVDRSVVVTVDLTTTTPGYKAKSRAPRRIYVPSKVWSLKVLDLARLGKGLPLQTAFLRVSLRNPYSGKEIKLSGKIYGGGAPTLLRRGGGSCGSTSAAIRSMSAAANCGAGLIALRLSLRSSIFLST